MQQYGLMLKNVHVKQSGQSLAMYVIYKLLTLAVCTHTKFVFSPVHQMLDM